jgi:hypothetical protein
MSQGVTMQKNAMPDIPVDLAEANRQLAEENAALHVVLQKSAEFARRQAEALAGISEMARALTRNEGLEKDRAFLVVTLEIFSEECAAEVNAHMGSLAAIGALQRSVASGEGNMRSPWPFVASVSVH